MTIPSTMSAAVLTGYGGPERLEVRADVAVPSPGPGDVLVAVSACGMNNTDINTRVGWYSRSVESSYSQVIRSANRASVIEARAARRSR